MIKTFHKTFVFSITSVGSNGCFYFCWNCPDLTMVVDGSFKRPWLALHHFQGQLNYVLSLLWYIPIQGPCPSFTSSIAMSPL